MHVRQVKLVLADDHPVVLLGVQSLLQGLSNVNLVGTAANSTELFAILNSQQVDMVLTDYAMPGGAFGDGMEMLSRLKSRFPKVTLIVLTVLTNPALLSKIVQLGVHGLLNKSSDLNEIPLAIKRVGNGYKYLSRSLTASLAEQSTRPEVDKIALLSKKNWKFSACFWAVCRSRQLPIIFDAAAKPSAIRNERVCRSWPALTTLNFFSSILKLD